MSLPFNSWMLQVAVSSHKKYPTSVKSQPVAKLYRFSTVGPSRDLNCLSFWSIRPYQPPAQFCHMPPHPLGVHVPSRRGFLENWAIQRWACFGVKDVSKLLVFRLISGEGHQNLLVKFLLAIPRYFFERMIILHIKQLYQDMMYGKTGCWQENKIRGREICLFVFRFLYTPEI